MLLRSFVLFVLFVLCSIPGCTLQQQYVPAHELTSAQLRAQDLYAQSQELQAAHAGAQQMIAGLQTEHQALNQQLADAQRHLTTTNERVENLLTERSELIDRYTDALETPYDQAIVTDYGANFPGFKFDHVTGLYKFSDDILFDLSRAILRPEMIPVLKDFVSAVSGSETDDRRILIVGHTDDLRIARETTASRHATNWHLSTNRADSVIVELIKLGVKEERMAAMGYSKFQPLETAGDETARHRNRRVELYLVPASGQVAQWDPLKALQ